MSACISQSSRVGEMVEAGGNALAVPPIQLGPNRDACRAHRHRATMSERGSFPAHPQTSFLPQLSRWLVCCNLGEAKDCE